MNQIKNKFLKCSIVFGFFMATATSYAQGNDLLGTWVFQVTPSVDKMPTDIKNDMATSTELQNHIQSFYTGRQMFFGANGTVSITLAAGQQFAGTWQIQGTLLNIIEANGSSTTYQIGALTTTDLVLLAPPDISSDNRQLFPELYFSKLQ